MPSNKISTNNVSWRELLLRLLVGVCMFAFDGSGHVLIRL